MSRHQAACRSSILMNKWLLLEGVALAFHRFNRVTEFLADPESEPRSRWDSVIMMAPGRGSPEPCEICEGRSQSLVDEVSKIRSC
jgi:hypothetical protein